MNIFQLYKQIKHIGQKGSTFYLVKTSLDKTGLENIKNLYEIRADRDGEAKERTEYFITTLEV